MDKTTQNRLNTIFKNLAKEFSLDKFSKSPARFSLKKLDWFNKEYLKKLELTEFVSRFDQYLCQYSFSQKLDFNTAPIFYQAKILFFNSQTKQIFAKNQFEKKSQTLNFKPYNLPTVELTSEEFLTQQLSQKIQTKFKLPQKLTNKDLLKVNTVNLVQESKIQQVLFFLIETKLKDLAGFESVNVEDFINSTPLNFYQNQDQFFTQSDNFYLSFPIWQNFCKDYGFDSFEPKFEVLKYYLALYLDQNRVTQLSEVGTDSGAVLNWQKPVDQDLKWKKISLEESKANLAEILTAIKKLFFDQKEKQQTKIITAALQEKLTLEKKYQIDSKNLNLKQLILNKIEIFENGIKMWLKDNDKRAGDYLWPLRVSLSGKAKSPSPFELLAILSQEEAISRIEACLR